MTFTLDRAAYGSLLVEHQPTVINSEEDFNRALISIERLVDREDLSAEEASLLELLSILVESYEDALCPTEPVSPHDVLLHLMEAQELKQADLVGIIGSKGVVSEIVNGKRSISKAQAKALGELFHVSPALFI
jgi:HTH-type transcriptional regulator/antitoxin HigA